MPVLRDRVAIALKKMCPPPKKKGKCKKKIIKIQKKKCEWNSFDKIQLIHGLQMYGMNEINQIRHLCLPRKSIKEIQEFIDQHKDHSTTSDIENKQDLDRIHALAHWQGILQKLMSDVPDYSTTIVQAFENFLESSLTANDLVTRSHDESGQPDWLAVYDYILCLLADEPNLPELCGKEARVLLQLMTDLDDSLNNYNLELQQDLVQSKFKSSSLPPPSSSSSSLPPPSSSSSSPPFMHTGHNPGRMVGEAMATDDQGTSLNDDEHDNSYSTVIIIKPASNITDNEDNDDVGDNNNNNNKDNKNNNKGNVKKNSNDNNKDDDDNETMEGRLTHLFSLNPLEIPKRLLSPKFK